MRRLLAFTFLFLSLLSLRAEDQTVRMNRVRHPVTKKWGYAFKEQNVNSPLHGVIATGVNWVGFGSQFISKEESELIDWVIPPHYDEVAPKFLEGLSMVRLGDKVGFINMYDCFVVKPQFEFTGDLDGFHEGLAAVRQNGKWGFVNHYGIFMIQPEYDDADAFNDNHLAAVKKDGKWGVIDIKGTVVVPIDNKVKQAMMNVPLSNKAYRAAVSKVKDDYASGAYAERIEQILNTKPVVEKPASVSKSSAQKSNTVSKSTKGKVNSKSKGKGKGKAAQKTAKVADEPKVEAVASEPAPTIPDASTERERLAYTTVGSGDSLGVKDQYGRWIVPPLFSSITSDRDDNMFIVKRDSLYGCYTWNGNRLVGTYFDSMSEFSGGKSNVSAYGVTGWIDKNGYLNNSFVSDICQSAMDIEKKNASKATDMYNRCIAINPDYASPYNNLALLDFSNKDYGKGIKKLKLAVKLDPENKAIANNLEQAKKERSLRRKKNWEDGLQMVTALISLGMTAYSAYSQISGKDPGTNYSSVASDYMGGGSSGSFSGSFGPYLGVNGKVTMLTEEDVMSMTEEQRKELERLLQERMKELMHSTLDQDRQLYKARTAMGSANASAAIAKHQKNGSKYQQKRSQANAAWSQHSSIKRQQSGTMALHDALQQNLFMVQGRQWSSSHSLTSQHAKSQKRIANAQQEIKHNTEMHDSLERQYNQQASIIDRMNKGLLEFNQQSYDEAKQKMRELREQNNSNYDQQIEQSDLEK